MASNFTILLNNFKEMVGETRENPVMDSMPLISRPYPVLGILTAYLLFVLVLGPRLMKNREPFDLKLVIAGYNAYQVLFSLWLGSTPLRHWEIVDFRDRGCAPVEVADIPVAITHASWWFFMSKLIELLDTVFFVLRKKQSQVTFLHVYHHTVMVVSTWLILKYVFVEHGIVGIVVNSMVHVMMYTYYLLAAMGPAARKYLWWKKYLTTIQLVQFLVLLAYMTSLVVFDCKLPKAVLWITIGNLAIFFYLFGLFYRRVYRKTAPMVAEEQTTARVPRVQKPARFFAPTEYFGLCQIPLGPENNKKMF